MREKVIITLVVSVVSLVPAWSLADGMPPSPGTSAPATPPASGSKVTMADLQPDAPAEYTVVKGDTLWGISGKFLKDPWKWPQIWQMNRDQIKDPHWIYPGDVIRLDRSGAEPRLSLAGGAGTGTGGQADAESNVVKVEPRVRIEPLKVAIPAIPGSVIGPFLTQPLVVETDYLDAGPSIVAIEESRVVVGAGDAAYADALDPADGVNWQIYRPAEPLHDPETGEILGYEAKFVGEARIRRYGDPTTLEVTKARMEVNRGDRLQPSRETVFTSYVPRAPERPLRGTIMSVEGGVQELGQYNVITINRGARDGVQVGHVLATYRRGPVVRRVGKDGLDASRWLDEWNVQPNPVVPEPPRTDSKGRPVRVSNSIKLPDERNGLIIVFRVFDKMSYALVMRASRPIYVGDVVGTP
jgi:LysM domain-containing protein